MKKLGSDSKTTAHELPVAETNTLVGRTQRLNRS